MSKPRARNRFFARGLLIAPMMAAASTSGTWVNFYQTTRRNNPEESHLHTRHRENLKSHEVRTLLEVSFGWWGLWPMFLMMCPCYVMLLLWL
jgi:hypothetical protein